MAQAIVSFRMDAELKRGMEETCRRMGLTMTSAFTMFATMVNRTQSIPFKIAVDPFYSEENMERIKKSIEQLESGKGQSHELIEVE